MKEIQNNIDTFTRKVFRDFEPTPPEHVWYNIVDELPHKPHTSQPRKTLLVAAALALITGSSIWMYFVAYRTQILESPQIQATAYIPTIEYFTKIPSRTQIVPAPSVSYGTGAVFSESLEENVSMNLEANSQLPHRLQPIPWDGQAIAISDYPTVAPTRKQKEEAQKPEQYSLPLAFSRLRVEVKRPVNPVRVRVGSHLALQNNFRTLSYQTSQTASFPFSQLENNIITFDAGISVVLSSRSRFSFQTGIHYSTVGQFVNSIDIYQHPNLLPLFIQNQNLPFGHPQTVITSHGFIRLNQDRMFFSDKGSSRVITSKRLNTSAHALNLKDQGLTQVFGFVELPLVGRFLVYDRSMDVHIKGGVAANYLISNQVFPGEGLFQQSIGETHGIRKFNFEGVAGLVFELPISTQLTFHLEPTAQFFFFPIVEGFMHFGRAVPYSYSIFTGIRYSF